MSHQVQRGKMISLESVEGAGKGTVSASIDEFFNSIGQPFIKSREPGGTPLAEEIRGMLLVRREEKMHPTTELLLMFAARAQHLNELILPNLNAGIHVFNERFVPSSIAYQGAARGGDIGMINDLAGMVCGSFKPDLTIVLDIDVELGLKRASGRAELDRIEMESVDFFNRARQSYLAQAAADPEHFAVIDASQSKESVKQQVFLVLSKLFAKEIQLYKQKQYEDSSMAM